MTINEFYARLRAKGDRLTPAFESALVRNAVATSDGKVVDLRTVSTVHAKMSGPVALGTLTDRNDHNIVVFPQKATSSADRKPAAISSRSDDL